MKVRDVLRAVKDADPRYFQEANALAAEASKKRRNWSGMMNRICKICIAGGVSAAAVIGGIVLIGTLAHAPVEPVTPGASFPAENSAALPDQTTRESAPDPVADSTEEKRPVKVGDRLYQVFSLPKLETASQQFTDGTAYYSGGLQAKINGKKVDFSAYVYSDYSISYWLAPDGQTLYFTNGIGTQLYQTDLEMHDPQLIFDSEAANSDERIDSLFLFPGQQKICFRGHKSNIRCFGTVDPITQKTENVITDERSAGGSMLSDSGVLFYDDSGKSKTVYYWENDEITQFSLQKTMECTNRKYLSENGKYLCTCLIGKTQEGNLTERYFVYDVKNGALLQSFDYTFETTGWNGFTVLGIDENSQSVYYELAHNGKFEFYQFLFGDAETDFEE